MQKKQDLRSGVTLVYVLDTKKQELYNIYEGEKILFENLTQDEYFNAMEDLAYEYYDNGAHNPQGLRTEIIIKED